MNTTDYTSNFDPRDIEDNKAISILCYLGVLLLIPFFVRKNSYYVKFHANQGLLLLIISISLSVAQNILNVAFNIIGFGFVNGILGFVFTILNALIIVLMIIGIINTLNGRAKELPIIGKVRLIKT